MQKRLLLEKYAHTVFTELLIGNFFIQLDLANLCTKAGLKNIGTVFLLTDAQVPEESFLVLINDLLASGEIPGLFADDEVENIISGVRNEVKGAGLQDTRENCWMFFIERVRRNLKVNKLIIELSSNIRAILNPFRVSNTLWTLLCIGSPQNSPLLR